MNLPHPVKGLDVFWLVFLMLVTLALAIVVIGGVAIPARREGRALFTPRGRKVIKASQSKASHVRVPTDAKAVISERLPRRKAADETTSSSK